MTAQLVDLVKRTPMDIASLKEWTSSVDGLAGYVNYIRNHPRAIDADFDAEWRLWGSGVHVMRAVTQPLERKDHWDITVVAAGRFEAEELKEA